MNNQPPEKSGSAGNEQVISLAEETAEVSTQRISDGVVRVTRQVTEHQQTMALMLRQQTAAIERIPKSERLAAMPAIREENGVLIIPIVEEEVEIVRHLVLKEEWHIRTVVSEAATEQVVTLRRQHAHLTRSPLPVRYC